MHEALMKEPGLDARHRDKTAQRTGEIRQKHGDTLNKNLPKSVESFSPNARPDTMGAPVKAGAAVPTKSCQALESIEEKDQRLLERKANWLSSVENARQDWARDVYENDHFNWYDALRHRAALFQCLAEADALLISFFESHGLEQQSNEFTSQIEARSKALFKELLEWHTPTNFQDPVPESFKRGMSEAMSGNVGDFPGERT
jgi:hypothetical protein